MTGAASAIDRAVADVSLETGWPFPFVWENVTRRQVELILSRSMAREARRMVAILDVVHSPKPREHRERLVKMIDGFPVSTGFVEPEADEAPDHMKNAERWASFAAGFGDAAAARRIIRRGAALRALDRIKPEGYANG